MNKGIRFWKNQILLIIFAIITVLIITEIFYDVSSFFLSLMRKRITNSSIVNSYIIEDNGIPVVDYGNIGGQQVGRQYVPVAIIQTGLEHYKSREAKDRKKFLNCVNWIWNHAERCDSLAILVYHYPFPAYDLTPPWRSAMAQGQALQLMIRADQETGNQRYLALADSLLNPMLLDVNEGGVTHKFSDNNWWYEEYADADVDDIMVLNGMMYTLLGLHEYYEYTNSEKARKLFQLGINSLVKFLPDYDRNGHSYYDILKHPAGGEYHSIHINQLQQLYTITNNQVIDKYYTKWNRFQKSPQFIQLLKSPPRMLLAVYLFHALLIFILLESSYILLFWIRKRSI